jgi:Stage II sporulation protein E (SpoIIE)
VSVPASLTSPRRYGSIAALARVLPARQLLAFWLGIGLTFAVLGFLIDVVARGRSAPVILVLNVVLAGAVPVALVWTRMTGHRRTFFSVAAIYLAYTLFAGRVLHNLPEAPAGRLLLDALGAMFGLMGGYLLFIYFINTSASRYLRARTEIDLAREIHRVLVSPIDRRIGAVEFYGVSFASGDVGGDVVDVVENEGGWLGYIADVSGHGVASGVIMGMFKSALRARMVSEIRLAALLTDLNAILMPLKPSASFITVAAVRVSLAAIDECRQPPDATAECEDLSKVGGASDEPGRHEPAHAIRQADVLPSRCVRIVSHRLHDVVVEPCEHGRAARRLLTERHVSRCHRHAINGVELTGPGRIDVWRGEPALIVERPAHRQYAAEVAPEVHRRVRHVVFEILHAIGDLQHSGGLLAGDDVMKPPAKGEEVLSGRRFVARRQTRTGWRERRCVRAAERRSPEACLPFPLPPGVPQFVPEPALDDACDKLRNGLLGYHDVAGSFGQRLGHFGKLARQSTAFGVVEQQQPGKCV